MEALSQSSWKARGMKLRLIFNLEGRHHSALTGKQTTDEQPEYAKKRGPLKGIHFHRKF